MKKNYIKLNLFLNEPYKTLTFKQLIIKHYFMNLKVRFILFLGLFFSSFSFVSCGTEREIDMRFAGASLVQSREVVQENPITMQVAKIVPPKRSEKEIFLDSVKVSAKRLKVPYIWLKAIVFSESSFNAKSQSKTTSAMGIIGFTKSTAIELGTTCEKLKRMSCLQQLPYAEKHFRRGIEKYGAYKSITDMKIWLLLPNKRPLANKPYANLMVRGDKFYGKNKGLDKDSNGRVQTFEITKIMQEKIKSVS